MPNTSELSGFTTKWKDLYRAAEGAGIPTVAIQNVYDLDQQRLRSGTSYQFSKAEAWSMLQSAGKGQPLDTPPPTQFHAGGLLGYLGSDVKDFGAGLMGLVKKGLTDVIHPTHAAHQVEALWRDPTVIEDPAKAFVYTITHPSAPGDPLTTAMSKSPLLESILPGVADVVNFQKAGGGVKGTEALAEHPFTSLLDVAPFLHGLGSAGRSLARAGLSADDLAAVKAAADYKPTDLSNQAQAARQAAKTAISGGLRRAAATSSGSLFSIADRAVMDTPFRGETMGEYLSRRVTASSRGTLGTTAAALGRIIQGGRRAEAHGHGEIAKVNRTWYADHGLDTPKERADFAWLTTHWTADWRQQMAGRLDPGEADKLENADADYKILVERQAATDVARGRNVVVQDPRTGEYEMRGTSGPDAQVAARYRSYLDGLEARNTAARRLADLTGNDVGGTSELAQAAVLTYINQAVLAPARRFVGMRTEEPAIRAAFPTVRAETVDPANPEAVRGLLARAKGPRRSQVLALQKLLGPTGLFAYLTARLRAGDLDGVDRLLGRIIPTARSNLAKANPELAALLPDLIRARAVIKEWRKTSTQQAFRNAESRRVALEKALDRQPEARFAPRMTELVQQRLMEHLNGQAVSEEDLKLLAFQVANGLWHGETYAQIIGNREMAHIVNSALQTLRAERDKGLDPRFVYSTTSREIPRIGAAQPEERIVTSRSSKTRARFNPSAVYDPIIGLTRKEMEDHSEEVSRELFFGEHGIVTRFRVSDDESIRSAMQFVKADADPVKYRARLDHYINEHYADLHPTEYFPRQAALGTGATSAEIIRVPKDVKTALDANYAAIKGPQNLAARTYASGTQLFRFTLLDFSPRYQVHIWGGGTALLLMRSDPISMARYLPAALGIMVQDSEGILRDWSQPGHAFAPVLTWLKTKAQALGETAMRPEISHGVAEADPQDLTNAWNFAKGKKMGGWMAKLMEQRGLNAGIQMATFGADMLRSLAYLIGKEKAGGDVEAGIRFALKVFADMDGMTPLERSIIRYVMPFYGWTKHILRYTATLPIDHPYRAALLSQIVNQEWQDWATGIPKSMIYLFELGGVGPDGSTTVLDIRQLDPLRSVDDVFTMAGFVASLNPAIQNVVLPALGIDPTTAGPEDLYPSMTIDQFYGSEQAAPRDPIGVAESGIAGYIPQASALETLLGQTSYARWAKANDPAAFTNQIFQALNWPWIPYKVNLYQVVAKQEERYYNVARDAATAAMNDPNPDSPTWKSLMAYSYVPYQGWYVAPNALRQWAFDSAIKAGQWNGSVATMAPSALVVPPSAPNI